MADKFYLCYSQGGVEFGLERSEPFATYQEREEYARNIFQGGGMGQDFDPFEDNLFWLNIDENGVPTMGAYENGELGPLPILDEDAVDESQA